MDDPKQLDRIEIKLDKVNTRQDRMELTMVEQHLTLKEHTRRSEMLEDIVLPIQRKMTLIEGGLKLLGLAGVVAGVIDVTIRIFSRL